MPPWASTAITIAPWAVVTIVAILVTGRIVDKVLDIVKIRTLGSIEAPLVIPIWVYLRIGVSGVVDQ